MHLLFYSALEARGDSKFVSCQCFPLSFGQLDFPGRAAFLCAVNPNLNPSFYSFLFYSLPLDSILFDSFSHIVRLCGWAQNRVLLADMREQFWCLIIQSSLGLIPSL